MPFAKQAKGQRKRLHQLKHSNRSVSLPKAPNLIWNQHLVALCSLSCSFRSLQRLIFSASICPHLELPSNETVSNRESSLFNPALH